MHLSMSLCLPASVHATKGHSKQCKLKAMDLRTKKTRRGKDSQVWVKPELRVTFGHMQRVAFHMQPLSAHWKQQHRL